MTSNDLILLKTKKTVQAPDSDQKDDKRKTETASYKRIVPKDGRTPIPRRDHSAYLIRNGAYLIVFGGKNDNAFELTASDNQQY
jgi:hypothetical protein